MRAIRLIALVALAALSIPQSAAAEGPVEGRYRCTLKTTDKQFGYTYRYSLKLVVRRGVVKEFAISQSAQSRDGDSNECAIDLGDLVQTATGAEPVLKAKDDSAGSDGFHCTIRLHAEGKRVVVHMGDASDSGNDCRGSGGTMFCTPRGNWSELTVNGNSSTCARSR